MASVHNQITDKRTRPYLQDVHWTAVDRAGRAPRAALRPLLLLSSGPLYHAMTPPLPQQQHWFAIV